MNRRGFLAGILALGISPAIVKASSLMPVQKVSKSGLWYIEYSVRSKGEIIGDIERVFFTSHEFKPAYFLIKSSNGWLKQEFTLL